MKEAAKKSDNLVADHKHVINDHVKVGTYTAQLATADSKSSPELAKFLEQYADMFERSRKVEFKKASDHDLKLTDTLMYFQRETQAAKDLCFRRAKVLSFLLFIRPLFTFMHIYIHFCC